MRRFSSQPFPFILFDVFLAVPGVEGVEQLAQDAPPPLARARGLPGPAADGFVLAAGERGVQSLVVLENEPDEYSALLPRLYNSIFEQSRAFKSEALNEHQQML
jgi:hypothetical protein